MYVHVHMQSPDEARREIKQASNAAYPTPWLRRGATRAIWSHVRGPGHGLGGATDRVCPPGEWTDAARSGSRGGFDRRLFGRLDGAGAAASGEQALSRCGDGHCAARILGTIAYARYAEKENQD